MCIRDRSKTAYSRVRIEVAETPFFSRSVSEFLLKKPRKEYTIYPDIIWNYEALKNEVEAEPVSVAITVEMNGKDLGHNKNRPTGQHSYKCKFLPEYKSEYYLSLIHIFL